jgi:hypothetical protein
LDAYEVSFEAADIDDRVYRSSSSLAISTNTIELLTYACGCGSDDDARDDNDCVMAQWEEGANSHRSLSAGDESPGHQVCTHHIVSDSDLGCRNQRKVVMKDMDFTNARYMISVKSMSQTKRVGECSSWDKARGMQDDDKASILWHCSSSETSLIVLWDWGFDVMAKRREAGGRIGSNGAIFEGIAV